MAFLSLRFRCFAYCSEVSSLMTFVTCLSSCWALRVFCKMAVSPAYIAFALSFVLGLALSLSTRLGCARGFLSLFKHFRCTCCWPSTDLVYTCSWWEPILFYCRLTASKVLEISCSCFRVSNWPFPRSFWRNSFERHFEII